MNKQDLIKNLRIRSKELAELSDSIAKSKAIKTEGTLVTRVQRGRTRLYRALDSKKTRYLSASDTKQLEDLATKSYLQKLDKAAQLEKEQIDRCIRILEGKDPKGRDPADVDQVYNRLPDYIRAHAHPDELTDEGYAEKWRKGKFKDNWGLTKSNLETARGEKVRSKSEWIITSMLDQAGVPYRYEEKVAVNPEFLQFFHTDFTVLNKRTRRVFYWEHFGMMDDQNYVENTFVPKMYDYYSNGFLPGENMIMTFETRRHPLNTAHVKKLIEHYLL